MLDEQVLAPDRSSKSKKRKSLPNTLTSLPGWVIPQYVRRGRKLHGPYYYHFQRVDGKLRKRYIPPSELERYRALTQKWREDRDLLRGKIVWRAGDPPEEFMRIMARINARQRAIMRALKARNAF